MIHPPRPQHPLDAFWGKVGEVLGARVRSPDAAPTPYDWRRIARAKQLPPTGRWLIWLIRTGRRWGKTKSAAEMMREDIFHRGVRYGALVSSTPGAVRRVMINGPSGLKTICAPHERPRYYPSLRQLVFPNGAIVTTYAASAPEDLRGPEHDGAWADEVDSWAYAGPKSSPRRAMDTFNNLVITVSRPTSTGLSPRLVVTSTPKRGRIVAMLHERAKTMGDVVITKGHTEENAANLDPTALAALKQRYEGTTLGRQELHGELLEDIEGALWKQGRIDELRIRPIAGGKLPDPVRIAVAVDPAGTNKPSSSETGIVAGFKGVDGHGYLTHDRSGRMSPAHWGLRAVELYDQIGAHILVGEVNHGGDMVESTIRSVTENINFKQVRASRGKAVRAEPIAAFNEQGIVHMVGDEPFDELEAQLCAMTVEGYQGGTGEGESPSPDRADAYVWLMSELLLAPSLSSWIG